MKTNYLVSVLLLAFLLVSCGKFSSSEKKVIKEKIFEMYDKVPKMDITNAPGYDFNISNIICRETITNDSILTDFITYILIDQKGETGSALTIDNTNFASMPIQLLIKDELKLTDEEFDRILVARIF